LSEMAMGARWTHDKLGCPVKILYSASELDLDCPTCPVCRAGRRALFRRIEA
jgi:hypothetical protein